ncbi:MAG: hypothetical protein ACSLE8_06430 [Rhodococcus sp. (in: high G+C Gram-positive bacteria)]
MSSSFFFYFQQEGKESKWQLDSAENRATVLSTLRPAFSTVLDLTTIPDDNDWSKVRYRGPFYADFDAEGDLELVCEQFKLFLLKLDDQLDFDLSQARYYATGSKGFHVEIDQACFIPKLPPTGTAWLPYVYRAMAESLIVDTLDLNVYTGKKGRQWRTPNVRRDNDCYKVQLTLEEAMGMTPELYLDIIKEPREALVITPPHANNKFVMMFERAKDKTTTQMRTKKKRQAAASVVLDPWKKAKKHPPTIEGLMSGEIVSENARFQELAMQLSIYAVSVEMPLDEFLDRCKGLCENHVSDSRRYNTMEKRREELTRMWNYMNESSLYDFDVGPLRKLARSSWVMSDLGVMETDDKGDRPAAPASEGVEGEEPSPGSVVEGDMHKGIRKGFFMNSDGMWKRTGDITEPVCRATLRNVESFYDVEKGRFMGYEFDVVQTGVKTFREMLAAEAFTSATAMKKFFVNHQIGFQGGDFEVMSLMDVMAEKAKRGGKVFVYPREGFMVMDNPMVNHKDPVMVYLTKQSFISSVGEDDPNYFRLRYRPGHSESSYNIDIHHAPELDDSMKGALHDLFSFTREDVAADLIGWFVACHYRSAYLRLFNQFPLLQIYGEAGSGKSQTVWMLAHLHWFMNDIAILSSSSCTPFAVDSQASTSTSAPFILDEFKPRELKTQKGKYEKLKDMFKASYLGGDIGNRGTLNKGAETNIGLIRSKATAPVVFMGEAIEMETAIIERCVIVNLSKQYQTKHRQEAFLRLHGDATALSALGREIVQLGFSLDLDAMKDEVRAIQAEITAGLPPIEDETQQRAAPRMIYNRAVVVHGLRTLKAVLQRKYGVEFDASIDALLATRTNAPSESESSAVAMGSVSEVSKVINRIALLSRDQDAPYEMRNNKDYFVGEGYLEMRVERAYDQYRRYCATVHDTPLFDSVEAFVYGLNSYSPCVDRNCADSPLREDGSGERIIRLSLSKLKKEGVQPFRS